jgi:hypothetical protein
MLRNTAHQAYLTLSTPYPISPQSSIMSEYNKPFFESEEDRERHSAELEAVHCERIGKDSGQCTVFMLPEHYNADIHLETGTFEVVEIPRVLKISNSISQAEDATAVLGLVPEPQHKSKAFQLVLDGQSSVPRALRVAFRSHKVDVLMGNPLFCRDIKSSHMDTYHMAYAQDYATPISELLGTFDASNQEQVVHFKSIIDAYVEIQLLLLEHGMFDKTFKLTDNYGMFPFDVPWIMEDRIRMLDLGELTFDMTTVLELVKNKEWEQIAYRQECTPLPSILQTHFNQRCEERMTTKNVVSLWRAAKPPFDKEIEVARVYDWRIPTLLPRILWENLQ